MHLAFKYIEHLLRIKHCIHPVVLKIVNNDCLWTGNFQVTVKYIFLTSNFFIMIIFINIENSQFLKLQSLKYINIQGVFHFI